MTKFLDVVAVTGASTQSTVDENSAQTGYLVVNPTTLTATGTLSATNAFNVLTGSTASQTATLPASATTNQQLIVSNQSSVAWTLAPNSGATISGQTSRTLQPNETVTLQPNATTPTEWNIIGWWGSDNIVLSAPSASLAVVPNAGYGAISIGQNGSVTGTLSSTSNGLHLNSHYDINNYIEMDGNAMTYSADPSLVHNFIRAPIQAIGLTGFAGAPLAAVNYAPTTAATYTTSSTTLGAIDSTNLTVTHTAQSTQTKIRATLSVLQSTGLAGLIFGLVDHNTTTQVPGSGIDAVVTPSLTVYDRVIVDILVTGLTVGTSYSWDLAWATKSATDAGDIGVIQSGSNGSYGIATIEAIQA